MKVDLHGTYVRDLAKKLDTIIHEAITNKIEEIEFITGRGPLQKKLIELCENVYGCEASIRLNNTGIVVVVTFVKD